MKVLSAITVRTLWFARPDLGEYIVSKTHYIYFLLLQIPLHELFNRTIKWLRLD